MLIIKFCWLNVCLLRLAALLKNASRKGQTVYVLQLHEKVHRQYMSKDTACCIKLPGHTYLQVALQIDEVLMKKCPVSCYINCYVYARP